MTPRSRPSHPVPAAARAAARGAGGPAPPLKWAGGKRWQLPHVLRFWRQAGGARLVEPFCGGLAVTLGLLPDRALLNDINPHVVNFYRWLQRGLVITIPMTNSETRYYAHRQRFNQLLTEGRGDTAEAASLFYYLNRTGYNGLCRFSGAGRFNVPYGRYATIAYRRDFLDYQPVFARWAFTSVHFDRIVLAGTDFVYADPPYDVEFTGYAKDGFDWDEQVATAVWLSGHGGPVLLSNQATSRIVELYRDLGYTLTFLDAPRRISCTGDRTPAREVLAFRNLDGRPRA